VTLLKSAPALRLRSGLALSSAIIIGVIVAGGPAARPSAQSAVTFSEQGFLGLRELNEQDYKTLADSYASTDDDEQEG